MHPLAVPDSPRRAVRTLVVYLHETNVHLAGWLVQYMNKNPINLASPDSEVRRWRLISQRTVAQHIMFPALAVLIPPFACFGMMPAHAGVLWCSLHQVSCLCRGPLCMRSG